MNTLYMPSSNTATNGASLGNTQDDVRLLKLVIGAPVSAGNITVYNITNPVNGASTNIAAKFTLPTFSTTNINPGMYIVDFGPLGLPLPQGGNIIIDQSMQVTAVWELSDSLRG